MNMWLPFALLAALCWAIVSVIESIISRHYEQHPVLLMWFIGLFRLIPLIGLGFFADIRTTWSLPLFLAGFTYFLGGVAYFVVIRNIDISVSNTIFATQAVFLSVVGFALFGERWSLPQTAGAFLIFGSVLCLSYSHSHISLRHTILWISLSAAFFVPHEALQKAALLHGQDLLPILFWLLCGNVTFSLVTPLLQRDFRKRLLSFARRSRPSFYFLQLLIVVFSITAMFGILQAYALGSLSLVAMAANTTPFFVILFAWLIVLVFPRHAPRELFTAQSLAVKLVSFAGVVVGTTLLAW